MARGRSKATLELVAAARAILETERPATVRGICYQLFTRGLIPNMGKNATARVSRILTDARERGEIPWEWIVDETRAPERTSVWNSPDEIIRATVNGYRRDYWRQQPMRVEVWSEKGTVRGVLKPVLDELGVTFRVMHGFASATTVFDIAQEAASDKRPFVALYVGDYDPSGLHMSEVDLPERLARYGGEVDILRVALKRRDLGGCRHSTCIPNEVTRATGGSLSAMECVPGSWTPCRRTSCASGCAGLSGS